MHVGLVETVIMTPQGQAMNVGQRRTFLVER